MVHAFTNMNLHVNAYHRIIKLARIMSDIERVACINIVHIGEVS